MHKAGARWTRCSDGDTTASSTSSEFIIYMAKQEVRQQFWGGEVWDIIVLGNRRNL
jgi:hypothetical protein